MQICLKIAIPFCPAQEDLYIFGSFFLSMAYLQIYFSLRFAPLLHLFAMSGMLGRIMIVFCFTIRSYFNYQM